MRSHHLNCTLIVKELNRKKILKRYAPSFFNFLGEQLFYTILERYKHGIREFFFTLSKSFLRSNFHSFFYSQRTPVMFSLLRLLAKVKWLAFLHPFLG